MVAPDRHICDVRIRNTCFLRDLCDRTIVIKASHCCELAAGNIRCVVHGNQSVCVCWVTHNKHFNASASDGVHRFTLSGEDSCIRFEQVLTLHARSTRPRTNEQGVISIGKGDIRVIATRDTCEQWEGAVVQLHFYPFERIECGRNV